MLRVLNTRYRYYPYSWAVTNPAISAVKAHVSHGAETGLHAGKPLFRARVSQFPPVDILTRHQDRMRTRPETLAGDPSNSPTR